VKIGFEVKAPRAGVVRNLPKQARYAAMLALNGTGFAARADLQAEMARVFDRPTPWVLRSVDVVPATRDNLVVTIRLAYRGGKGVDPNNVLQAEILGGPRKTKRFERALQKAGVMLPGYFAVPGSACPLDAFGNIPGSFIVRLLSYLQAFPEQGYRANATAKTIKRLAKRGKTERGFKTIRGVEYFVSHGKGERSGKQQQLPRGIWQRSGIHGSDTKPVLLFVRAPRYKARFDMAGTIERTVERELLPRYSQALARAVETAR
jgi:hypothetical protein